MKKGSHTNISALDLNATEMKWSTEGDLMKTNKQNSMTIGPYLQLLSTSNVTGNDIVTSRGCANNQSENRRSKLRKQDVNSA